MLHAKVSCIVRCSSCVENSNEGEGFGQLLNISMDCCDFRSMFALGLGLVFSVVCIPLITQCLCAPLLYSEGLVKSCKTTPTAFGVWPRPCTRGNEPRDSLAKNSIVKTARSDMG
jgi:hypothetical protein